VIKALMHYTILEVEVSGDTVEEFAESLGELKDTIQAVDREFDSNKKVWIVRNVEKYKDVPWVVTALEDRIRQPTLF
jgi:hypothetical protein